MAPDRHATPGHRRGPTGAARGCRRPTRPARTRCTARPPTRPPSRGATQGRPEPWASCGHRGRADPHRHRRPASSSGSPSPATTTPRTTTTTTGRHSSTTIVDDDHHDDGTTTTTTSHDHDHGAHDDHHRTDHDDHGADHDHHRTHDHHRALTATHPSVERVRALLDQAGCAGSGAHARRLDPHRRRGGGRPRRRRGQHREDPRVHWPAATRWSWSPAGPRGSTPAGCPVTIDGAPVSKADADAVRAATGYPIGGVSPVGLPDGLSSSSTTALGAARPDLGRRRPPQGGVPHDLRRAAGGERRPAGRRRRAVISPASPARCR